MKPIPIAMNARYRVEKTEVLPGYVNVRDIIHEKTLMGRFLPKIKQVARSLDRWTHQVHPCFGEIYRYLDLDKHYLAVMPPLNDAVPLSSVRATTLGPEALARIFLNLVDAYQFLAYQDLTLPRLDLTRIFQRPGHRLTILGHEASLSRLERRAGDRLKNLDIRYAAPELLSGGSESGKADIYHLGALVKHFLTGKAMIPGASFEGVTRTQRKLKKQWDTLLGDMLAPDPQKRPDWAAVRQACSRLLPRGVEWDGVTAWLGAEDRYLLPHLEDGLHRGKKRPQAMALQVFPGREKVRRLAPFSRLAHGQGFLVLHSWTTEVETRRYKTMNDILVLLREGVIHHMDRPDLEAELVPLSEWQSPSDLLDKWRDLLARVFKALVPEYFAGILLIIEDIQNIDRTSLETLCNLASWLGDFPFVLTLTGHSFAHPHYRELASRWPFGWRYLHPRPLQATGLGDWIWQPEPLGTDQFQPQRLMAATRGEEILIFYALGDQRFHAGSFNQYLEQVWSYLKPKEQMILKIMACSVRPLGVEDLKRAFQLKRLKKAIEYLQTFRILEGAAGYEIAIPAFSQFCRQKLTDGDRRHIQTRLYEYETHLEHPDQVQLAFLEGVLHPGETPTGPLKKLEEMIFYRFDLEPLWRLERLDRHEPLACFHPFVFGAGLLRGRPLKRPRIQGFEWLRHLAAANRQREKGELDKSLDALKKLAATRGLGAGLKAHALVLMAECAVLKKDGLAVATVFRKFKGLQPTAIHPRAYAEGLARMATALIRTGRSAPGNRALRSLSSAMKAWVEANRLWMAGEFKPAMSHVEEALTELVEHYDLNWKGLALKLHGNILFRRNRPEAAVKAYRESEKCFMLSRNRVELDFIRFNLATTEILTGRFASCAAHFQPIYEETVSEGDLGSQCQILYNFMVCSLFVNDIEAFEKYNREHEKLACRLKFGEERIKGLSLRLHNALARSKDEVLEDIETVESLLQRENPYALLRHEAETGIRIGRFAVGLQAEGPAKPYPRLAAWRHQFLDLLTGMEEGSFTTLLERIGKGYFRACHLFLLKTAIEAGLLPAPLLDESLAQLFERQALETGARYGPFLKTHFANLHGLGEVPREEWDRAINLFESLRWRQPRTSVFLRDLLAGFGTVWPHLQWGACHLDEGRWRPLPVQGEVGDIPFEIRVHFQNLHPDHRAGPTVTTLIHPNTHEARGLLLLPIDHDDDTTAWVWFLSERAAAQDLGSHYEPLFRFYGKLFEYVLYRERAVAVKPRAVHSTGVIEPNHHGIVGQSRRMREVLERIHRYGPSNLQIFIWGESGTGKELVAKAVHQASDRAQKPFRAVNCSHFPENLVEAELFGHARGSYTGATADRAGVLELVDGGTLFLDEIGDINPKIQSLLLRVIQEGEFSRIGETRVRKVDIRFVTATNKDLHRMIDEDLFRGDLFFRLVEEEVRLPALRERFEDLPPLAAHFVQKHEPSRQCRFSREFFEQMRAYTWPGNVREFESYIRKLLVHWRENREFTQNECLPFLRAAAAPVDPDLTLEAFENANRVTFLKERLARYGWNRTRAAASLGISRQQLANLIAKYRLRSAV